MEDDIRAEVRAIMLSAQMELPEYSADPVVQRRLGKTLSDASGRRFRRLNIRGPYSV